MLGTGEPARTSGGAGGSGVGETIGAGDGVFAMVGSGAGAWARAERGVETWVFVMPGRPPETREGGTKLLAEAAWSRGTNSSAAGTWLSSMILAGC